MHADKLVREGEGTATAATAAAPEHQPSVSELPERARGTPWRGRVEEHVFGERAARALRRRWCGARILVRPAQCMDAESACPPPTCTT